MGQDLGDRSRGGLTSLSFLPHSLPSVPTHPRKSSMRKCTKCKRKHSALPTGSSESVRSNARTRELGRRIALRQIQTREE